MADIHTPRTMMAVFANAFRLDSETSIFLIQGIFRNQNRSAYGNYYYDRLRDAATGTIIRIKLPASIKQQLRDGDVYTFKGIIDKSVRDDGVIEPLFIVVELQNDVTVDNQQSEAIERGLALQRRKANAGFQDVDNTLQSKLRRGIKPHLIVIHGSTSEAVADIKAALNDAAASYRLDWCAINITDRDTIVSTFTELRSSSADAIAITRGGGLALEIFDDLRIAEAALLIKSPLITAMGHARDETLLQKLADKGLETPTALGNYLRLCVSESQLQQFVPVVSAEKSTSASSKSSQSWWWLIFAVVVTLAIGIVIGMYLL
ncbi:MAG: hypothetical protein M9965_14365 [Anaerolineae bacterium]|nr:hypothetical protein [Anaerolineae bacterium]